MNLFKRKKTRLAQERRTGDNESLKDAETRPLKDCESVKDREPSKTRSTHFSLPYTGEFTTI